MGTQCTMAPAMFGGFYCGMGRPGGQPEGGAGEAGTGDAQTE
jgi:hypothetical protein